MGLKLHKTTDALVISGDHLTTTRKEALIDKTETLHLIHDRRWIVSSQRNGLALYRATTRDRARIYMEYMLKHASVELQNLPTDAKAAIHITSVDGPLKKAHIQALKH